MSRIGKRPIQIPEKVKVEVGAKAVHVQGPKGTLEVPIGRFVQVAVEDGQVLVRREDDGAEARAMQGLTRSLLANALTGVSTGFNRVLEINGVGYRAEVKGKELHLTLGLSHPVVFPLPEGVSASVDRQVVVTLSSHDKQLLGEVADKVRSLRPPEPYKGKGIKYADETIRRKQGKTGA
jgi:large subunit ribosomal protein L6